MKLSEIKQLSESEFFTDPAKIKMRLKSEAGIDIQGTYEVVNGLVNVTGSVAIKFLRTAKLPFKFGTISGNFEINDSQLVSLEGCPHLCNTFNLTNLPKLLSLEYCPTTVNNSFYVENVPLVTSLNGMPKSIGRHIGISVKNITSLEGMPLYSENTLRVSLNGCINLRNLHGLPKKISVLNLGKSYPVDSRVKTLLGIEECEEVDMIDFEPSEYFTGGLGLLLIKTGPRLFQNANIRRSGFDIIQRHLNAPDDLFECQQALIDMGFEEIAEL